MSQRDATPFLIEKGSAVLDSSLDQSIPVSGTVQVSLTEEFDRAADGGDVHRPRQSVEHLAGRL